MKIAIWKTGHQIADTVADALHRGFGGIVRETFKMHLANENTNLGYGILRGMDNMARQADSYKEQWFLLDRGYFNPGHFDGYYRISYKGTQAKWHDGIPRKAGEFNLQPIVKRDGYILICPPTPPVCEFFSIKYDEWIQWAFSQLQGSDYRMRTKGMDDLQGHLDMAKAVITFNSSVGWEALRQGIPVLSDVNHSICGSYYKETSLDILIDNFLFMPDTRVELFEAMNAHQFKLDEIAEGKAWSLINHYVST